MRSRKKSLYTILSQPIRRKSRSPTTPDTTLQTCLVAIPLATLGSRRWLAIITMRPYRTKAIQSHLDQLSHTPLPWTSLAARASTRELAGGWCRLPNRIPNLCRDAFDRIEEQFNEAFDESVDPAGPKYLLR